MPRAEAPPRPRHVAHRRINDRVSRHSERFRLLQRLWVARTVYVREAKTGDQGSCLTAGHITACRFLRAASVSLNLEAKISDKAEKVL